MKIVTLVVLVALLSLAIIPGNAIGADDEEPFGTWAVMVDPEVVFAGDEATIYLKGLPTVFVYISIESSSQLLVFEDFVNMGPNGTAAYIWPVPLMMPSDVYTVNVEFNGKNVTAMAFEIIFEIDIVQDHDIEQMQKEIAFLEEMVRDQNKKINRVIEQRDTFYLVGVLLGTLSIAMTAVFLVVYRPVILYYWGKTTRRGGKQAVYSLLKPPRRGYLGAYHEYVEKNLDEIRAKKEAARGERKYAKDLLFKADPNNPFGHDVTEVEVKDVSDMTVRVHAASPEYLLAMKRLQMNGGELKVGRSRWFKKKKNGDNKEVVEVKAEDVGKGDA